MTRLEIGTINYDDLTLGLLNPFLFGNSTPHQQEQVAQRAAMYQLVYGGTGNASVSDAITLTAPEAAKVATTVAQARRSLDSLRAMLATLFGVDHSTVRYLTTTVNAMSSYESELERCQGTHPTLPALIQRYVQVELAKWAKIQENRDQAHYFDAKAIIEQAAYGDLSWQLPLPPSIKATTITTAPSARVPTFPATQAAGPPTAGPQAAGLKPARPTGANAGTKVYNENFDSRFQPIRDRLHVRSKEVRNRCFQAQIAFPTSNNGTKRCLTFHVQGLCNTNCGNATDHHNLHSPEDQQALLTFAEEHWKAG